MKENIIYLAIVCACDDPCGLFKINSLVCQGKETSPSREKSWCCHYISEQKNEKVFMALSFIILYRMEPCRYPGRINEWIYKEMGILWYENLC